MSRFHRWLVCSVLGMALVLVLSACRGRTPSGEESVAERSPTATSGGSRSKGGHVALLNLRAPIPEETIGQGLFPTPARATYVGLVEQLRRLETDSRAKGVFVRLGPGIGFHRAEELSSLFGRVRARHKPIVCHAHELDNSSAWLAIAGCDDLWLSAAGDVATVGIGAELSYLKGAFDKLGVQADMLAMGKYKSGGEALTREGPTDESLGNLRETLSHLRSIWLAGISKGRADPDAVMSAIEDGPWTPERARDLGLVHHVGFEDEALVAAKRAAGTDSIEPTFGAGAGRDGDSPLAEIVRLLAGAGEKTSGRRRLSVVPAVGAITMEGSGPFGGDGGITAQALTKTLRRLREDTAVRAIVLRLDSPGGSPLASDLIWREIMLAREQKPVIVSIGSMAASGGYYIASAATKIVAPETAIVGSIGVFGGKIVLGGALERFGVTHHGVAASSKEGAEARSLYMSPLTPWDEPTRERVRTSMKRIYDLFVARVAEGRGLERDAVYRTAEGAIFLAGTGKERGLIDQLGGLDAALALARREANLNADIPVVVEGAAESLMESLFLGPGSGAEDVQAALEAYRKRAAARALSFGDPKVLTALQPFAAACAPLLSGESAVVALPFALTLH